MKKDFYARLPISKIRVSINLVVIETMISFLRKNLMIVVSVALPLLVVIFFALASILPGLYATPPAYDLLITHQGRALMAESPVRISLTVQGERLRATVSKSKGPNYGNRPRIFRYDHVSGNVREIDLPIPEDLSELPEGSEIPVPELARLRISNALRAPDGYEFRGYRRGGGLMTELFGGSRNRHNVTITKDGATVRLRLPASDYWYGEVRFLGWVID